MSDPHQLDVDGHRPAVAWVAALPRAWASAADRHVLLVLALDTYDQVPPFESAPSTADLCEWTGEHKGTLLDRIKRLAAPLEGIRPPLLEVTPGAGRKRSSYRLMTESGPALWSGWPDHKTRRSGRAEQTTSSGRAEQTTNGRSGLASGLASGRAEQTTPSPYPPVPTVSSTSLEADIAFVMEEEQLDQETAADVVRRAHADPKSLSPSRRLRADAYRRPLVTQVLADANRCEHGVAYGARVIASDGSHHCPDCDRQPTHRVEQAHAT